LAPPGSSCVDVEGHGLEDRVRDVRRPAGSSIVAVGAVRSSSHVQLSGELSTLPCGVDRADLDRVRAVGGRRRVGVRRGAGRSRCPRRSALEGRAGLVRVEREDGAGSLVRVAGFVAIVVFGSVRSTVTAEIDVDWWPTWSIATALDRVRAVGGHRPAGRPTGAEDAVPSSVVVPPTQSLVVHE